MIDELRQKALELGIKVDGRWKEDRLLQVIADASDEQKNQITDSYDEPEEPARVDDSHDRADDMNAYALRIWSGQSPDMPKHERIERVQSGLKAQGWGDILDKLSLPNA